MRLRLFSAVSIIMLVLALVLVACGGGESSASTGGTGTSSLKSSYKPTVKLVCIAPPCGSYPPQNAWHGTYYAEKTNFPAETLVVITATYPNGKPYPTDQYTSPGELFGIQGNVQQTDEYGQLPEFKWAAVNENGRVDPQGVYRLTFRFKYHGEKFAAHARLRMGMLP